MFDFPKTKLYQMTVKGLRSDTVGGNFIEGRIIGIAQSILYARHGDAMKTQGVERNDGDKSIIYRFYATKRDVKTIKNNLEGLVLGMKNERIQIFITEV